MGFRAYNLASKKRMITYIEKGNEMTRYPSSHNDLVPRTPINGLGNKNLLSLVLSNVLLRSSP
jgi:hypothetical protein